MANESDILFDRTHCVPNSRIMDYTDKVLVLAPLALREECRVPRNQLWLAESGFGCSPTAAGRAVFGVCLEDGELARWDRSDFIGIIRNECLPDWAWEKLVELQGQEQKQEESFGSGLTME